MREATVLAHQLSVHAAAGDNKMIGYLKHGERVLVTGAPPPGHSRQWWRIETNRPFSDEPNINGWVAEGDGKVTWLAVDPAKTPLPPKTPLPAPPKDFELDDLSVGYHMPPWWVVVMVISLIALSTWMLS